MENPKIVAIGGGTGLPVVLTGLKKYTKNITAIVCVTDSGKNSGLLRKELNMLPPGDIRNCLLALSNSEEMMKKLFSYRFGNGTLEGSNMGNLFLAAMAKITGSFEKAVKETGKILKLNGKVLPSTLENAHICAELTDGTTVEEELNVRQPGKSPIKRAFLKPEPAALEECINEIVGADAVVIGPGALYTSVITNLLVKGIADAINRGRAKKIYVCNITEMPGQTDGFTASMHAGEIMKYLAGKIDCIILNRGMPEPKAKEAYERQGSFLVNIDMKNLEKTGARIITGDLLTREERKDMWDRLDYLRHDPDKLAKTILSVIK